MHDARNLFGPTHAAQRVRLARVQRLLEKSTYELYFGEAFENAAAFALGRPVKLVNSEVRQG